jgi:hypothetical protein
MSTTQGCINCRMTVQPPPPPPLLLLLLLRFLLLVMVPLLPICPTLLPAASMC